MMLAPAVMLTLALALTFLVTPATLPAAYALPASTFTWPLLLAPPVRVTLPPALRLTLALAEPEPRLLREADALPARISTCLPANLMLPPACTRIEVFFVVAVFTSASWACTPTAPPRLPVPEAENVTFLPAATVMAPKLPWLLPIT